MTTTAPDLATALDEAGVALTPPLRRAFQAVNRADFLPAHAWVGDGAGGPLVPVDSGDARWRDAAGDPFTVIVTQFDDGDTQWPEVGHRPTSSCSAPSAVARMLLALDPQPGDHVLEIGTGSGWNAALLAELVGREGRIDTVEIDAEVAGAARERLITAGYDRQYGGGPSNVRALLRDGADVPAREGDRPYDRVLATASVMAARVPYGWVEHTRPGGVLVAPMRTELVAGPLVRFEVGLEGVARGRAVPDVSLAFMELRADRAVPGDLGAVPWAAPEGVGVDVTELDLISPFRNPAWEWAIGVGLPRVRYDVWEPGESGGGEHGLLLLQDPVSRSWASVHGPDSDGRYHTRQDGPRALVAELRHVLGWFAARHDGDDPPPWEAWRWEVGPGHQTVALE